MKKILITLFTPQRIEHATIFTVVCAILFSITSYAHAYQFVIADPSWAVNLDTTLQYTVGMRVEERDSRIANSPTNAQSDYLFDRGDIVTNRLQALLEFQATYKDKYGLRVSGSIWKDWALRDDDVAMNPNFPASFNVYPDGHFSQHTQKYHIQGEEILDAFVFSNFAVGEIPVSVKLGRTTQMWGNAMFFGFSNIAYSQHAMDYIKGFTQPGSEVKELFLPRAQLLASIAPLKELSITGQYFFENANNRFPEGGTYLAPADILFDGPNAGGPVTDIYGNRIAAGQHYEPDHVNNNFGLKVAWSPSWAGGEISFIYRNLDEVQPWTQLELYPTGGGNIHLSYNEDVKLYGLAYQTSIGEYSCGIEASYRTDTALNSLFFSGNLGKYREGAKGNITNVIGNILVPFGTNFLWDTATLIAEVSYTHLHKVTENRDFYVGRGYAAANGGGVDEGAATDDAVGAALSFTPEWLSILPSTNLSLPMFIQGGISGNPAYAGGSFFAEGSYTWSVGLSADFLSKYTLSLKYLDYYWRPSSTTVDNGFGKSMYAGGNGTYNLNDKGWIALQFKMSF